jgi:hypothetical protein
VTGLTGGLLLPALRCSDEMPDVINLCECTCRGATLYSSNMNDNLPHTELPELATFCDRLVASIELMRDAVSLRVGYEVEMAGLEPLDREGHAHLRVYWRRKSTGLRLGS